MTIYEASLSIIINHHDPWSRHVETVLDVTGSTWWRPGAGPTAVARSAVYRPRRLPARLAGDVNWQVDGSWLGNGEFRGLSLVVNWWFFAGDWLILLVGIG